MSTFTTMQLDALRELANIGSGTAGTALSQMLGRSVDISVPNALVLPLAEAVEAVGPPEQEVTGVAIPLAGDMDAVVLLVFPVADAASLFNSPALKSLMGTRTPTLVVLDGETEQIHAASRTRLTSLVLDFMLTAGVAVPEGTR